MPETKVKSELNANVWKIEVMPGAVVAEGDTLMILETMKMEIPVAAPCAGTVSSIEVKPDETVQEDQVLAIIAA